MSVPELTFQLQPAFQSKNPFQIPSGDIRWPRSDGEQGLSDRAHGPERDAGESGTRAQGPQGGSGERRLQAQVVIISTRVYFQT